MHIAWEITGTEPELIRSLILVPQSSTAHYQDWSALDRKWPFELNICFHIGILLSKNDNSILSLSFSANLVSNLQNFASRQSHQFSHFSPLLRRWPKHGRIHSWPGNEKRVLATEMNLCSHFSCSLRDTNYAATYDAGEENMSWFWSETRFSVDDLWKLND